MGNPEIKKLKDYNIKDSGERTEFGTGAVRDLRTNKGRFDLIPPATLRALAIHFERGCEKYGDRNWEKGIPLSKYIDSGLRHAFQYLDGREDGENHLIAVIWNFFCLYETQLRIQSGRLPAELNDLPRPLTLSNPYGESDG